MRGRSTKALRGGYRISAVARLTGVSSHALRVWERRYNNLSSGRSGGGYRLYTDADVARISAIKVLLDAGQPIGQLVELSRKELEKMRTRLAPPVPEPLSQSLVELTHDRFLAALETLDVAACERTISGAALALEPIEFMMEVVSPLLTEVGARWAAKSLTIAQEHAATVVLRGQLVVLLRGMSKVRGAPTLVSATPAGEAHEVGAMLASVTGALRGYRVVYLGPSLPPDQIADAVRRSSARAVALSVVALTPAMVRRTISEVRAAVPRDVALFVGGSGVRQKLPVGAIWTPTLEALGVELDRLRERSP